MLRVSDALNQILRILYTFYFFLTKDCVSVLLGTEDFSSFYAEKNYPAFIAGLTRPNCLSRRPDPLHPFVVAGLLLTCRGFSSLPLFYAAL